MDDFQDKTGASLQQPKPAQISDPKSSMGEKSTIFDDNSPGNQNIPIRPKIPTQPTVPNIDIPQDDKIDKIENIQDPVKISNSTQAKDQNTQKSTVQQPINIDAISEPLMAPPTPVPSSENMSSTLQPSENQDLSAPLASPQTSSSPPPAISSPPPPPPPSTHTPSSETPELKPPEKSKKGLGKIFKIIAILVGIAVIGFLLVKVILPRIKGLKLPKLPGQETTITYWGLWEPKEVMKPLIEEFNDEHPEIVVEYVQQSHKDYRERLQSAIARGEGPDIFRFHNSWVPMLRNDLASIPAEIFSASEFQETFYPVAVKDLRNGANFVGIPLEIDGLALFYNKDIFESAGKLPPSKWEELRNTAYELTVKDKKGTIQTSGVALGTASNVDHWSDILALMMLQNGTKLNEPTDKYAADALLFYTIFSRSDKVWDETLPRSTQAFASGKVAMYFAPSWRIDDLKTINPDLNFGVLPVPQLPDSKITWASYWVEGVSAKSEKQAEAWEFLKFLSQKETLEKFYAAAVASGRTVGEPFPRKDMSSLLENDPLVGVYIRQAPNATSWYVSSFTHDNGINDKNIKYFEDAVNSLNQERHASTQKILDTVSQGVKQVLGQYRAQ